MPFGLDIPTAVLRGMRRKEASQAHSHRIAEHEGRVPQPGVPRGPRQTVAPTSYQVRLRAQRAVNHSLHFLANAGSHFEAPSEAIFKASFGEKPPAKLASTNPAAYATAERARITDLPSDNLGEPEDLTNAILAATGAGDIASLARAGAETAVEDTGAAAAKQAIADAGATGVKQVGGAATQSALLRGLGAVGAKRAAARSAVRGVARGTARKAEPSFIRTARQAAAKRVGEVPKPIRVGVRTATAPARLTVKHPFSAPVAAEVPAALLHGNPGELGKAFSGKGTLASIDNTLAKDIAPYGGKIAKEAVELPTSVLPSTFLAAKAGVNAAQGDNKEWDELKKQYLATGLLPAIASGDPSLVLKRFGERPLLSALEGSGAASVLGRGAGAAARAATHDHVGGLERPALTVPGYPNLKVERGNYSRDLFRQGIQRAQDRRSGNVINTEGGRRGRAKFEHRATDSTRRFVSDRNKIQKQNRRGVEKTIKEIAPQVGRGPLKKLDTATANIVVHAIERIVQHPETFAEDLPKYRQQIDEVAHQTGPDGKLMLDKGQLKANREMVTQLDQGIARANPAHVVKAADAFIAAHQPIVDELTKRGLLAPDQALHAAARPFAVVHMGAEYGVPNEKASIISERVSHERQLAAAAELARHENPESELAKSLTHEHGKAVAAIRRAEENHSQLLDPHGDPLSLAQIKAEMERRGIQPAGFISHRPGSAGDYYTKPFPSRAHLPRGVRTGLSTAEGTHASGWDAVAQQMMRSQSLLDASDTYDKMISHYGVQVPGVHDGADAARVIRDPARHKLPEGITWEAVRRYPWASTKGEIQGALENQHPSVISEDLLSGAFKDPMAGDGPITFIPKPVMDEARKQYAGTGKVQKTVQAVTTGYKRAVLPFSPTYQFQVPLDNWLKAGLAGINPVHMYLGRHIAKNLSEDDRASLLSGERTSEIDANSAHRTTAAVFDGEKAWEAGARSVAAFRAKPGVKQFVDGYRHTSNALLKFNAVVSERLPEYGSLGKAALQDFRATQHSWGKAIVHMNALAEDYAKGLHDPAKLIRAQKSIEDVLMNWTNMSAGYRKVTLNIVPFANWIKNATKFVYSTMPAHRPIQTALLTAVGRMTQPEREKLGLSLLGNEPLPPWLQGNIPFNGGITQKINRYTSFGFFGSPAENIAGMIAPVEKGPVEALEGRDWKGNELGGTELSHIGIALKEFLTSFTPGFYTGEGLIKKGPLGEINPLRTYPKGEAESLRRPQKEIKVPATSGGSSSSGGFAEGFAETLGGSSGGGGFAEGFAESLGK
jgi:hypothetical protein